MPATDPASRSRSLQRAWGRTLVGVLLVGLLVGSGPFVGSASVEAGGEEGIALTSFSERIDARAYPFIAPAIAKLDAELVATGSDAGATDPSIQLATWAAHGPGFLRHVKRGRGLDCLAAFDLGTIPASGAADRALERAETVLQAFAARSRQRGSDPALVPWKVEGLDADGRLNNRKRARGLLERALRPGGTRARSVLLPRHGGGCTACVMDAGEVPLPALTRAHYLSSALRYGRGTPPAARPISVTIFFALEVVYEDGSRRPWILVPTIPQSGMPVPFRALVFLSVFPNTRAHDRFADLLAPEADLLCARIRVAADLLRAARAGSQTGAVTEALEQMHQALDLMGPVYGQSPRSQLICNLSRWLDAPAARELSDLAAVAGTMQEVASDPELLSLFAGEGALDALTDHWRKASRDLARQLPGSRTALVDVVEQLDRLAGKSEQAEPASWGALADRARALARSTGPDARALASDLTLLERPFLAAGWRFLPVYGAKDRQILVSAAHLAGAGVPPGALRDRVCGDFTFEIVHSEEAPLFRLPLRVVLGSSEGRVLACLRCRLAQTDGCLRWRIGCARAR